MNPQSAVKRTRFRLLLPAAAGLRPLLHVVDGAEGVRHAVLAAVPHQQDVDVGELRAAVRAAINPLVERGRLGDRSGIPVRSL